MPLGHCRNNLFSFEKNLEKEKKCISIPLSAFDVVFAFVVYNCCYFDKVRVSCSALKTIGKYNAHELLDLIGLK